MGFGPGAGPCRIRLSAVLILHGPGRESSGPVTGDPRDRLETTSAGDAAQRLRALAGADGRAIDPTDLDGFVHDLVSTRASAINNGGLDAQIPLLLDQLGEADTEQVIRGAAGHR